MVSKINQERLNEDRRKRLPHIYCVCNKLPVQWFSTLTLILEVYFTLTYIKSLMGSKLEVDKYTTSSCYLKINNSIPVFEIIKHYCFVRKVTSIFIFRWCNLCL